MMTAPRTFISYAWTSPDHEQWVLKLATDLRESGVDVILDKWDLREGHDAIAFMEGMVSDPNVTKVAMVCDRRYVERSNGRQGGVGTEAQIISPQIYASQKQDKFAAIVRELDQDGQPIVPMFYKSRIHIDMSDEELYPERLEQLIRWTFDKPLFQKPALGNAPKFITEADRPEVSSGATSIAQNRALQAIRSGTASAGALLEDYFSTLAETFKRRIIDPASDPFDDAVVSDIQAFDHKDYVKVVDAAARHHSGDQLTRSLHKGLEKIVPLMFRPAGVRQWTDHAWDNRKFIAHEMFLYTAAALLNHERFSELKQLLETEFYFEQGKEVGESKMFDYRVFRAHLPSLERRSHRLATPEGRRTSIHSDILKERCVALPISFPQLMQADLVLFLRSVFLKTRWWPETLLYADRGGPFEVFARSKSLRYFNLIAPIMATSNPEGFRTQLKELEDNNRLPKYSWHDLDVDSLTEASLLGTVP